MNLKKSELQSLIITSSLWVIFLLCAVFIPVAQKEEEKKYISVKLTLAPVEKIEKLVEKEVEQNVVEEEKIPAPESVQKSPEPEQVVKAPEPVKTEPVKAPEPVKTEPVKTEPVKKTEQKTQTAAKTTPSTPVKQELQKSVEESMAEQNAKSTKKSVDEVDWDALFGTSSTVATNESKSSSSQNQKVASNQAALSGSAGTSSANSSSVSATSQNQSNSSVQSNTNAMLSKIVTKEYVISSSSFDFKVEIKESTSNDGSTVIQLEDGKIRKLIFPREPKITLPENAKIEKSVNIEISFQVLKNGSVTNVKISNEALISPEVANEIKRQIENWRFDESDSDGHGLFNYSIIKK